MLVSTGGAAPAVVPIAAEGGACWSDESALLVLATPGL